MNEKIKIGIITDIHSNREALKAVLKEFEQINIDKIICCGDIIGIGPEPEETVQMLIEMKDRLITVRGNHEEYLISGLPKKVHDNKRTMGIDEIKSHEWNHDQLSEESKSFLNKLPIEKNLQIGNKRVYIIHYPTNKKHLKNPTINECEELFAGVDADIFLYGHTHHININNKDNKWYINSGALGCPSNSNVANVGLLEIEKDKVNYQQLSVLYNVDNVIDKIKKLKFPFYKEILKIFYGNK